MIFYCQVSADNIITDVIEYPYRDYVEIEVEGRLPAGVSAGWFKLEEGKIVEYPELKPVKDEATLSIEITKLKESQVEQDELIMQLILGGV
ncbi:hypothetical protein [Paenibacillus pini]|uniref:Uncharacterized protein n=1 Tax=Paenibacillus pini JCM 16418 TaxID=1236976 RepID=W7YEB4_9BACL|nr:hypothetical protein [Paenibacillus pini]GAF06832.1 hypothetical protein JCM16418_814 [Paenibacillus pini JCM 16418]